MESDDVRIALGAGIGGLVTGILIIWIAVVHRRSRIRRKKRAEQRRIRRQFSRQLSNSSSHHTHFENKAFHSNMPDDAQGFSIPRPRVHSLSSEGRLSRSVSRTSNRSVDIPISHFPIVSMNPGDDTTANAETLEFSNAFYRDGRSRQTSQRSSTSFSSSKAAAAPPRRQVSFTETSLCDVNDGNVPNRSRYQEHVFQPRFGV